MRQAAVVYEEAVVYSSACLHESSCVQFMGHAHADLTYRAKATELWRSQQNRTPQASCLTFSTNTP